MDYHKKAEKIWSDILPLLMANEASAVTGYRAQSAPPPVPPMPPAPPAGTDEWASKGTSGFREEDEIVDV